MKQTDTGDKSVPTGKLMEVVGLATTLVLFIAWVYAGLVNQQANATDVLFYPFLVLKVFCIVWLAYTLWRSVKARTGR